MSLRCRVGDLAMIVRSNGGPKYLGRIVEVVAPCGRNGWYVEPKQDGFMGVYDDHLRPIRPDEGEDEILRIAGKPEKVSA